MIEKETIKYFDKVIDKIDDEDFFSIRDILFEIIDPKGDEKDEQFFKTLDKVISFGKRNLYFFTNNKNGWYELTSKGIELKDF